MIKAIFWDNDGVLVNTEELYFQATERVLGEVGIALTSRDYMQFFLVESRGAWHLAAERGVSAAEIARLRERRNAVYGELLGNGSLVIDGVVPLLDALRGNYTMGVVTSSRRDHFDIIHRTTGLLGYFDFVLTSDDCTHTKPHPELYENAVARSGFSADECVAIEDSARGLAAAAGAGVRCVVIPTSLTRGSDFSGAHRVLAGIAEVPSVLREM